MEIQYLLTFERLAREKNFSKTAEAIHLTQPTVTARIQALEGELGEKLFERSNRGVELTEAGKAFLPYVQRILAVLEEGQEALNNTASNLQERLTIGSIPTIVYNEIPYVLENYRKSFPAAKVVLKTGHSHQVVDMLLDRIIQVGLVRSDIRHPQIRSFPLYDDPILLVVYPSHPLAGRHEVQLENLRGEEVIVYDSSSGYWQWLMAAFRQEEAIFKINLELDSIDAIKEMVARCAGISFLPQRSVQREISEGRLGGLRVAGLPRFYRRTVVIYRREKDATPQLEAFLKLLKELFPRNL